MNDADSALVVFQGKGIRRKWHDDEWYFSVVDVVEILTDSPTPRQYWGKIKDRAFTQLELSPIWVRLKLPSKDGKQRLTDCANTENMFRLIQSIPSKKAEPFKRWLAQVGYERVQEIENPELAQKRMKELYRAKGYSDAWIEKRLRGIAVRDELTDEWDGRGIETDREFSILTAEISKATFGLTPTEYLAHKGLKRQNLRDYMNDLELIFTMLGEAATTEIARSVGAQGFEENKDAAKDGGAVSGDARRDLETKTGRSVVSDENYLETPEKVKRLGKKK
ncbi:MAG: Bro-N domain-containing protein [Candidatus Thermoplasmatota archaeon]|nr:Bro-N domain-containing protein [Euryarchaeota archaeon]MBU4031177.1 Bro-N domain-containing protein [Candidatus Thermoplasmatota archaeon]MBU4071519.1 Bro-N domain-containing protein [Candidatus Thermoplasmatota archaeon]MBU4144714.1 Bro-N domain-containing protein [Candidatus Thermoplasmatota archaeon]MBU4592693.1 Bro-N domain-containing protein [Candidatus Thermoplasmatota archaeon]